jgi:15-cis-phytoene synthase/lycopene beta-cyclase
LAQAVLGLTLFRIPIEELFFFLIQTYITSSLYALLSRPVVHASFLRQPSSADRGAQALGAGVLASAIGWSAYQLSQGGSCTYLSLILLWACPFLLFLWSLASIHIIALPLHATLLPIALSTAYFWLVDTVGLGDFRPIAELKLFRMAGRAAKRHLGHRARHQAQLLPLRQPRPGVSWP